MRSRKVWKRVTAIGMTVAMTVSLAAGCSSKKEEAAVTGKQKAEETKAEESKQGETEGYTDYSNGFPENVTIKIPVYDRSFEDWDPVNNYYTQWIQKEFGDKYNVTVQYVSINPPERSGRLHADDCGRECA